MSLLENESVKRVRAALLDAGVGDKVIELSETARSAQDAADSIGTELGSIVKSLVFLIGDQPVMALVAGDHKCKPDQLPRTLNLDDLGEVSQADADAVRTATGFSIGGVPPVGLASPLPTAMDVSLKRFETIYAAAGHPHCVFPTTVKELRRLSDAIISYAIAERG
jgi:prolyl-tRNA editing enzyme YbaK/EbsC (Cys-tRNA(Pro) deacylase)